MLRSKIEHAKKVYDWGVVIISRGVGSLLVAGFFLVKKLTLPADEFASLGLAFASVLMIVSAAASPLLMLISRRIIQSRRLETDRNFILSLSLAAIVAASFSIFALATGTKPSEPAFVLSLVAIVLITGLNGQYVIWLNETGATRRSMAFIACYLAAIPASLAIRHYLGIGRSDRTFGLEALMLSLPIVADMAFRRTAGAPDHTALYHLSFHNYAKYVVCVGFFNAIPAADWWFGRHLLPAAAYQSWADSRILFERGLLPVMNVVLATILWRLLRSSIGSSPEDRAVLSERTAQYFVWIVGGLLIVTLGIWALSSFAPGGLFALFIGYAAYGITSIFLEFYQAKCRLWPLIISLGLVFIGRGLMTYGALAAGGVHLFSVAWAATALATLAFIFIRSRDQIALGRKS